MSKSRTESGTYSRSRTRSPSTRTRSTSRGRGDRGGRSQFKVSPEPKRIRSPREGDNPSRIWVGGLDDRVNDEDLELIFKKFGDLVEIKIRSTSRDTFAFVEFKSPSDAKAAMEEIDQTAIRGNTVKCNWAQFKSGSRNGNDDRPPGGFKPRFQIWVGRLNEQTTEDTIRDAFKEFGDILSMQLRSTSKDVFCFVEYDNSISCEKAIESYHERELDGARLNVEWSQANNRENDRRSRDHGGRGDRFRISPRRSRYDSYRDRSYERDRRDYRDRDRGRYDRDRRDYGRDRDRDRGGRYERDRYPAERRERFEVTSRSPIRNSRSRSRDRHRDDYRRTKREIPKGKYKIQIENLPSEMTWMDLKTMGRKYGGSESVTFARTWKMDGLSMGLVEFRTKESMTDVIEALDGHRINGNKIRVLETDDRDGSRR